jgi:hypothetical protein
LAQDRASSICDLCLDYGDSCDKVEVLEHCFGLEISVHANLLEHDDEQDHRYFKYQTS